MKINLKKIYLGLLLPTLIINISFKQLQSMHEFTFDNAMPSYSLNLGALWNMTKDTVKAGLNKLSQIDMSHYNSDIDLLKSAYSFCLEAPRQVPNVIENIRTYNVHQLIRQGFRRFINTPEVKLLQYSPTLRAIANSNNRRVALQTTQAVVSNIPRYTYPNVIVRNLGQNLTSGASEGLQGAVVALNGTVVNLNGTVDNLKDLNTQIHNNYKNAVKYTALAAIGTIGSYYSIKYLYNKFNNISKPKLVTDCYIFGFYDLVKSKFVSPPEPELREMIFPKDIANKVDYIIESTKNISKQLSDNKIDIKYNNLLLVGSSGTGKTMLSQELAKRSGMNYALVNGSSFSKFSEKDSINEMDILFSWANKSKRGLLLVIDEADAFLYKRGNMKPNSKDYKLLSNFLSHTSQLSDKIMIVLCTNYKDRLDSAILSRMGICLELPLPGEIERAKVLALYRNKILLSAAYNSNEFIDSINSILTDTKINSIAQLTQGLSNRDLENIINFIRVRTMSKEDQVLTQNIVDDAVNIMLQKYKDK